MTTLFLNVGIRSGDDVGRALGPAPVVRQIGHAGRDLDEVAGARHDVML